MKPFKESEWLRLDILFLALFSVFIHLIFMNNLEYHRDELLYFSLGMHPAAGYASVPPLTPLVAWLMEHLFGYSLFAVRVYPALLSGAIVILCSALATELGGSGYASFVSGLGLLISVFFMRAFGMFQPVCTEIFLWTLIIFLILKYINTGAGKYLLLFGMAAGVALLNKYLAGMLLAGLVVIIPFTKYREVFGRKMFWAGILAGSLIFLPNLVWQVRRGWPVFHHMDELYNTQLVHMNYRLFLTDQLLMPFAASILTVAGIVFLLAAPSMKRYRFLGFLSMFVILALMFLKGKSYYTLGVFPFLVTAGAVAYDRWLKGTFARILLPLLMLIITIPIIPMGMPVFGPKGLKEYFGILGKKYGIDTGRRFEDGTIHSLPQDYADMLGWEEMTFLAYKAYQMVDDKKSLFIYGQNYGEAGAITVIGKKYGLPQALSFNESFQYWLPDRFEPDIRSVIYINDKPGEDLNGLFRKVTLVGRVDNPDAREYGVGVYLCEDPAGSFNLFWQSRLRKFRSGE